MPFLQEMCQQGNLSPCDLPKFKSSTTFSQGISEGSYYRYPCSDLPFFNKRENKKRNQNCRKIQLSTNPTLYPSVLNLANFLFLQLSSVLNPNCSQSQFSIREVQISGITMMQAFYNTFPNKTQTYKHRLLFIESEMAQRQ